MFCGHRSTFLQHVRVLGLANLQRPTSTLPTKGGLQGLNCVRVAGWRVAHPCVDITTLMIYCQHAGVAIIDIPWSDQRKTGTGVMVIVTTDV